MKTDFPWDPFVHSLPPYERGEIYDQWHQLIEIIEKELGWLNTTYSGFVLLGISVEILVPEYKNLIEFYKKGFNTIMFVRDILRIKYSFQKSS